MQNSKIRLVNSQPVMKSTINLLEQIRTNCYPLEAV